MPVLANVLLSARVNVDAAGARGQHSVARQMPPQGDGLVGKAVPDSGSGVEGAVQIF